MLLKVNEARLAYELIVGRCSDNHWYRILKIFQENRMELTVENVQFFAKIRQAIPRSLTGIGGLIQCYVKAEKLLSNSRRKFTGLEVLTVLNQYGIKPHQSTITRWFKPLGGYRRDKEYFSHELKPIFTSAFIYLAHQSTKLPEAN